MPELLRMPEVAAGATSAILSAWSVATGEEYAAGSVIAVIETEKAVVDMEVEIAGRILRTLVSEGADVAIGDPIAVTAMPGEDVPDVDAAVAALGAGSAPEPRNAEPTAPSSAPESARHVTPLQVSGERIFISPIARKRAREAGVDIATLTGTGPQGRIRRRDVESAIASGVTSGPAARTLGAPAASTLEVPEFEDLPHSRLRRAIANRLTQSVTTAPHFYVKGSARVDRLLAMRAEINSGGDIKVSVNDLLIKAMARTHALVPAMNAIWMDDHIRRFRQVDIAMAVSTDTGLVTPVLRDVDSTSLRALAQQTKDLAQRARSGDLRQHELEGGSTSISNLGMYGTEEFTAIINPPHASILAVGAARPEAVVIDGEVSVATVLRVSLSIDHRPVDGAIGAEWMREFVALLEAPSRILT